MEYTAASTRFIFNNLFGITYNQYLKMFGLKNSVDERRKFREYCECYKKHYDAIAR